MVCPPILCPEAGGGKGIWRPGGLFQTLRGGTGHMGWLPTARVVPNKAEQVYDLADGGDVAGPELELVLLEQDGGLGVEVVAPDQLQLHVLHRLGQG